MSAFQSIGVHLRAFTSKRFVSLAALAGAGFSAAMLVSVGVYLATIAPARQALPTPDTPTATAPIASVAPIVPIVPIASNAPMASTVPIASVALTAPGVNLEKGLPVREPLPPSQQRDQGRVRSEKQEVRTERTSPAIPSLQKITPVAQAVRSARQRPLVRESDLPASDPLRVALPSMHEMERACNRATLQETMPPSFCSCDAGEFDQLECHVSASVASGALR